MKKLVTISRLAAKFLKPAVILANLFILVLHPTVVDLTSADKFVERRRKEMAALVLARRTIRPSDIVMRFRAGGQIRLAQGIDKYGNQTGPIHDMSDFHFADGRPAPQTPTQQGWKMVRAREAKRVARLRAESIEHNKKAAPYIEAKQKEIAARLTPQQELELRTEEFKKQRAIELQKVEKEEKLLVPTVEDDQSRNYSRLRRFKTFLLKETEIRRLNVHKLPLPTLESWYTRQKIKQGSEPRPVN